MKTQYRKKLEKIYKKIKSIALIGRDNDLEYYKYIDELIESGNYSYFVEVLLAYYDMDISLESDIESYKKDSWNEICFKTKSQFLESLSEIYKKNNIYQQSYDIYVNDSENEILGQIIEDEAYTKDAKYLMENVIFTSIMGEKISYLEVRKANGDVLIIDSFDRNLTPDQNRLEQYKAAIEFLTN